LKASGGSFVINVAAEVLLWSRSLFREVFCTGRALLWAAFATLLSGAGLLSITDLVKL